MPVQGAHTALVPSESVAHETTAVRASSRHEVYKSSRPYPPGALSAFAEDWKYHHVAASHLSAHKRYAGQGRPIPSMLRKAIEWPIQVQGHVDNETMEQANEVQTCEDLEPRSTPVSCVMPR